MRSEQPIRLLYRKVPGEAVRWLEAPWGDILSMLVFGQCGAGKSWAVVHLCLGAVRQGLKLIVADPHAGSEESLVVRLRPLEITGCFRKEPYRGLDASVAAFNWFRAELIRRMDRARRYEAETGRPWTLETDHDDGVVLVVDELNQILRGRRRQVVVDTLKDLVQAGRKYGLYAVVTGQWASTAALGGEGELRGCFPSRLLMRMPPSWASRIFNVPVTEVPMAGKAYRGEGYLMTADGKLSDRPWWGRVPRMSLEHVELVAREIAGTPCGREVLGEAVELRRQEVSEAIREELEGQSERVLLLLAEGRTQKEVMSIVMPEVKLTGRQLYSAYRVMEDIVRPLVIDHVQRRQRVVA
jgi:hypothetical protein